MRLKFWLLLSLVGALPHAVWAHDEISAPQITDICRSLKALSPSGEISALPEIVTLDLPATFTQELLLKSFADKWKHYRNNPNFTIVIPHLNKKDGETIKNYQFGESIQANFLKKLLQQYFPLAKFVSDTPVTDESFEHPFIVINIDDFGEFYGGGTNASHRQNPSNFTGYPKTLLNMQTLKAANPGLGQGARQFLREQLKIPSTAKVLSIYSRNVSNFDTNYIDFSKFLSTINASADADIIFFSRGGTALDPANEGFLLPPGYKAVRLSEVQGTDFQSIPPKLIVVNDLRGRVPYLHAIADATLVAGPINIFESLAVGTPEVVLDTPSLTRNYNGADFRNMMATAIQSGGTWVSHGVDDAARQLGAMMSGKQNPPSISPPHRLPNAQGQAPLDQLLDNVSRTLSLMELPIYTRIRKTDVDTIKSIIGDSPDLITAMNKALRYIEEMPYASLAQRAQALQNFMLYMPWRDRAKPVLSILVSPDASGNGNTVMQNGDRKTIFELKWAPGQRNQRAQIRWNENEAKL